MLTPILVVALAIGQVPPLPTSTAPGTATLGTPSPLAPPASLPMTAPVPIPPPVIQNQYQGLSNQGPAVGSPRFDAQNPHWPYVLATGAQSPVPPTYSQAQVIM